MKLKLKNRGIFFTIFLIFCFSTLFSETPGGLIWQSCTGWGVHSVVPTGDIDGDGIMDLFTGSGNDVIVCFSGGGSSGINTIWTWPVGSDVWSVANLEDINGDGINDCLAGAGDNKIYCVSGQPTEPGKTSVLWTHITGGDVWTVAPIKDLNGDGINDCLAGSSDDSVYCLSGINGKRLWYYKDPALGEVRSVTSIPDVNGDGKDDCLAGGQSDKVLCISGGSSGKGQLIWYYKTGSTVLSISSVEDVNGDGVADCFVGGEDDKVYCLSGKSSGKAGRIWVFTTQSTIKSVARMDDANGDGITDCLAGGQDDRIYCMSGRNGTVIWSFKTGSTVLTVNTISDVTGNGGQDCIAGGQDNKVYCIEGKSSKTGKVLWSSMMVGSVVCVTSIFDLNGNGIDDVVGGSDDSYVYVYEGGTGENISACSNVTGSSGGKAGENLSFSTGGSSSDFGHTIEYQFDWGDGNISDGGLPTQSHAYVNIGNYIVKARARCSIHSRVVTDWSPGIDVAITGHTLNVATEGEGSVTIEPDKAEYNHNENVILTAVTSPRYQLDHWDNVQSSSNNPATIIMDTDKNITAYFVVAPDRAAKPDIPIGPPQGAIGAVLTFNAGNAVCNYDHELEYVFDWGDGNQSDWGDAIRTHIYNSEKTFQVKSKARCVVSPQNESDWSEPWPIIISITGVHLLETAEVPRYFKLFQNYPNPFNGETCIHFHLPKACEIIFEIFNINGKVVAIPAEGYFPAGAYQVQWKGNGLYGKSVPSGLYLYRLKAGSNISIKEMLFIK
jgi:hypothetical protein